MKILVTGAGGFIGGTLAQGLVANSRHEVIGMYHNKSPDMKTAGLRMFQCDLVDGINLTEHVDYIVHCAAVQNPAGCSVKGYIDANLAITENVAEYAKQTGVKGVVFISSISMHGKIRCAVVDENTDRINPTLYGDSKYLCEAVLRDYAAFFPVVALRLCGVVGRGTRNNWLSRVRALAESGEDIPIYNSDMPFNNILHTDDLLGFLSLLIESGFNGFSAFPVASIEPLSIRDTVDEVVKGVNSSSRIIDKGPNGNSFIISSEYASRHFGYIPTPVRGSLRKYFQSPG
jgi:nucleoside-diphosphate-sugar epimerase